jgi:hypothetical protein
MLLGGDRISELAASRTEHARTVDAAFVDRDCGDAPTERDNAFAPWRLAVRAGLRRSQRADEGQRYEVDCGDGEAGLLYGSDQARGGRLVGRDEEDLHHRFAVFAGDVAENREVENGFVHRDRDEVGA